MANRKTLILIGVLGAISSAVFGCVMAAIFGGAAMFGFATQQTMQYEAEVQTTRVRLHQVKNSIDVHVLSHSAPPEQLSDMLKGDKAVIQDPKNLEDAWGQPFVYRRDGEGYTLSSKGPDGQEGTEDDVLLP